jgi:hypothetical protein
VAGFPRRGLLRRLRQHDGHRDQLPWHSIMPSLVHMLDVRALGRLPVAVLVLASCKSTPMPWSGCVLSTAPRRRHTCTPAFGCRRLTSPAPSSTFRLLSRVGEGDISALGCGLTGSCSSTFQRLQPWGPSWRNGFASLPVTCGLRHPASWRQVTAAWAHTLSQQRARRSSFSSFLMSIPAICTPDHPGRGAL